ncbi:hypothetical protein GCM10023314_30220 [Algibacter agarivorans]|uniref:Por secretion system C-terminal sorting domain-containing protein n=1 Tax=Algibacter agarivorans TaxID=1109741 RepID=A0ABP9GVU9_9FLAO
MKKITFKVLMFAVLTFNFNANAQHCVATGAGGYNVAAVVTTGGTTNIDYAGANGTDNYLSSAETVTVSAGETINIAITNENGWSRSIAYIDFNGDDDFDDAGERLPAFSAEKFYSGDPGETYNMDVTIPGVASLGSTKLRVLSGDAWAYNDDTSGVDPDGPGIPLSPCGVFGSASWKDFNIVITDPSCTVTGAGGYNVAAVVTTGGSTNIDYAGVNGTDNYLSSTETVTISAGATFNLAITNGNGWSRSIAYIDFNGDDDFDDAGERLPAFSAEKFYSGDPGETYDMDVAVPSGAIVGPAKMRILSGDAWAYNDDTSGADPDGPGIPLSPCGVFGSASWKDFNVQIEASLGVDDLSQNLQFSAYPNPLRGNSLNLRMNVQNENVNVKLYSITGKLIKQVNYKSFNKSESIDVSALFRGVYLLNVNTESGSLTKKIVK